MEVTTNGIDLAKSVFAVSGVSRILELVDQNPRKFGRHVAQNLRTLLEEQERVVDDVREIDEIPLRVYASRRQSRWRASNRHVRWDGQPRDHCAF
jgi:hypothetical protein